MNRKKMPPPKGLSDQPDKATREQLADMTGHQAEERLLFLNLRFIRFGTRDATQAGALILCLMLSVLLIADVIAGFWAVNGPWSDKIFGWASNTFVLFAGIAVGRGTRGTTIHES
jgi:hypothetical protein